MTSKTGIYKQLAHYPRNSDGSLLPQPRIANYSKMEYSGERGMAYEEMRLKTFTNWPSDLSFIKPEDLAKAGFYYVSGSSEQRDRTKCTFCRGVLHSWERGDEAMKEHRRAFSSCPFVLSMDVGNVPKPGSGTVPNCYDISSYASTKQASIGIFPTTFYHGGIFYKRCNMNFMSTKARIHSFLSLSVSPSKDRIRKLSKYGFYYTGQSNVIACYKCHFQSPITNNRVVEEHAESIPACPYLMQQKIAMKPDVTTGSEVNLCDQSPVLTDSEAATRMDSWVVRKAIELGFDKDIIKYVVLQHLNFSGENFLSIQQLMDRIQELQNLMQERGIDMSLVDSLELWKDEVEKMKMKRQVIMEERNKELKQKIKNDPKILEEIFDGPELKGKSLHLNDNDLQQQETINERLKSSQYCKICMDRPVDVIFVPCHHTIACRDCANIITDCSICRRPIESTLQANLEFM